MRNRHFIIFGGLAVILAVAIFLVLNQSTEWQWYWKWLIAMNVVTFLFYGFDKVSSKAEGGRVPELLLHLLALAGGFAGALAGIFLFHHKRNFRAHPLFLPVIIVSAVLWGAIIYYLGSATP
jgi:uncharacterized membrane protein YsdA (DUF1294 family)